MLTKLLKYDLKFMYKILTIFYILVTVFAVITRLLSLNSSFIFTILTKVSAGVTISFMVSIIINNISRILARFIRNLYGDESYLTHTLPVEKKTIYLAKFISALITMFTSVLVIAVSLFICYYTKDNLELLKQSLSLAASSFNINVISLLLIIFFVFFLEMSFVIVSAYAGIIRGHRSNNGRIIKSVIYSLLFYFLTQSLTLLIVYLISLYNPDIALMFSTNTTNVNGIKSIMFAGIVIYIIYIIFYYLVGLRNFEKGVDVN